MSWEHPKNFIEYITNDKIMLKRTDVKSMIESDIDINIFYGKLTSFNSIAMNFNCVLGMTGTGKTNTCARILEELIFVGMPLIIFDVEDDYSSLKELKTDKINIISHPETSKIRDYILMVYEYKESLIFGLSNFLTKAEQISFVFQFTKALWEQASENKITKDIFLVYDEAHEFAPQEYSPMDKGIEYLRELRGLIVQLCIRGRKKGIHGLFATQRPQRLLKDVISQTNNRFLHRVIDANDIEQYRTALPSMTRRLIYEVILRLKNGECFFRESGSNKLFKAHVLKRRTFHRGKTSQLNDLKLWKSTKNEN